MELINGIIFQLLLWEIVRWQELARAKSESDP